jgi:hypothetical protein
VLLAIGVPILGFGLLAAPPAVAWIGLVLVEAGLACFLRQCLAFYRARIRKRIDVGMRFARVGLLYLGASAVMGPILLGLGVRHMRLATIYVVTGALGGLTFFVIGFFYKIVPLLAWTVHYRERMGRGSVPTVAETFSARVATIQLRVMASGVLVLVVGIATGWGHLARCGAVLFGGGVLLLASQIGRVALGRRS